MEEIRDVTFGLWGEELPEWMAIQRLVRAGFHDPRTLLDMFAIIEGESGSYTRAWHLNVQRELADGDIVYDESGQMTVRSIDLGFIQRNVIPPNAPFKILPQESIVRSFVDSQFSKFPRLARADTAAEEAYDLFVARGFAPWYAYQPGTSKFKQKKLRGAKAIGNYLIRTQVGKVDESGNPADTFVRLVYE